MQRHNCPALWITVVVFYSAPTVLRWTLRLSGIGTMQPLFVTCLSFSAAQCENNHSPPSTCDTGSRYRRYLDWTLGEDRVTTSRTAGFKSQAEVWVLPPQANTGLAMTPTHGGRSEVVTGCLRWQPLRRRQDTKTSRVVLSRVKKKHVTSTSSCRHL